MTYLLTYPLGGDARYTPHRDNVRRGGNWLNDRVYTLIAYCNEGWREANGGALRLYPHAPEDGMEPAGVAVDVMPRAGTVLLFRSDLLHEVRPCSPCTGGPSHRMALTMWACARRV